MAKRAGHHERTTLQPWGNSILFYNAKFWTCVYCGNLIKHNQPFMMTKINGNPTPFILCSEHCLRAQMVKLDAVKG